MKTVQDYINKLRLEYEVLLKDVKEEKERFKRIKKAIEDGKCNEQDNRRL